MSLSVETAYRGATLAIRFVHCTPAGSACGPVEHAAADRVVFPLRGVFVKHEDRGERRVADPCHALFFRAGAPYRVSHPVDGGDDCLVLEPTTELLEEVAFRQTFAPLESQVIAARQLLRHRLARGLAGALEAEERAVGLLVALGRARREPTPRPYRRHAEMVDATRLTLAGRPAEKWTLHELAKRVYSSPWHLARIFRELAGLPLHRYHLRVRLAAALGEVLDSSRELTAIGLDLGFSSHSHFTASFRKAFGVTPSALRKSKILTAAHALER